MSCRHPVPQTQADNQSTTVTGMNIGTKTCLIMDEVDGMSAGDRGGVGALNVLIKKTRVSHENGVNDGY